MRVVLNVFSEYNRGNLLAKKFLFAVKFLVLAISSASSNLCRLLHLSQQYWVQNATTNHFLISDFEYLIYKYNYKINVFFFLSLLQVSEQKMKIVVFIVVVAREILNLNYTHLNLGFTLLTPRFN